MIFAGMFLLGCLLGCAGTGGAGLTIALLTVGYSVSIHTAIAVSLSCMTFTVLSGAISHYREGEVLLKSGLATGAAGILGALAGTRMAFLIPPRFLAPATAIMLLLTTALFYVQLFHSHLIADFVARNKQTATGNIFYLRCCLIGLVTGTLSGAFGIGATAFIQISLMLFFGVSLYQAIGTTMLIIFPIAAAGGLSYLFSGMLDPYVFIQTLAGLTVGSFIGAKFTHLIPKEILRYIMIAMPLIGGLALLTH
ncbi:MAG: sulfite exporter TauE/SafE family protein [Acidaminococcaceae bacterium]|nr:sulfite exporter TauE/SafE family protein [Acidaminococcaceae bacterium]